MNNDDLFFHASIYLKGDNLDPSELTSMLGTTPTRSHKKGERWQTPTGSEVIERVGLWAITIKSETGLNLSEALESISQTLSLHNCKPAQLPGIEEAYIDIFIATDSDKAGNGTCRFDLNEETLAAIAKLNLPVRFTVDMSPAD